MRYRLRTLLIVLAIGPLVLAWGWSVYQQHQYRQRREQLLKSLPPGIMIGEISGVIHGNGNAPIDWEDLEKKRDELMRLNRLSPP